MTIDETKIPLAETPPSQVRKASMHDIHPLLALINAYAADGVMLPRTEFEMSENIRDFSIIYSNENMIACGALHFYSTFTAEVRSLAVDPAQKSRGLGRTIVETLEAEARANGLYSIFAFTYVPGFFRKLGFAEVERGELPLKAWKDCLRCPKFQNCDEIAMLKRLRPDDAEVPSHRFVLMQPADYVQLPVIQR